MNITEWFLFIIAIIASSMTVLLLKQHTKSKNDMCIIFAIISELVLIFAYLTILNNYKMNVMYPIIKIMSMIIVVFVGVFLYDEHMIIENKIGIVFGIVALLLLSKK